MGKLKQMEWGWQSEDRKYTLCRVTVNGKETWESWYCGVKPYVNLSIMQPTREAAAAAITEHAKQEQV
jgi:hypothetical protein